MEIKKFDTRIINIQKWASSRSKTALLQMFLQYFLLFSQKVLTANAQLKGFEENYYRQLLLMKVILLQFELYYHCNKRFFFKHTLFLTFLNASNQGVFCYLR